MLAFPVPQDNGIAPVSHRREPNATHPVCRSPMMSSRCPRPMGTRLSTALMPVCMGSLTEVRGMMPGAFLPTRCLSLEVMGPCTSPVGKNDSCHQPALFTNWLSKNTLSKNPGMYVCMCVCVRACAYVCLLWVILQSCMAVTTHLVKVGSRFTISSYKVRVLEKISNR